MLKNLHKLVYLTCLMVFGYVSAFAQTPYYSTGTSASTPAMTFWTANRDGTGGNPTAYGDANIVLVVQNGHSVTLNSAITMVSSSVLEVETGGIFNAVANNPTVWIRLSGGRYTATGTYTNLNYAATGNTTAGQITVPAGNFRPTLNYLSSVVITAGAVNPGNNSVNISGDLNINAFTTFTGTNNNTPTHTIGGSINVRGSSAILNLTGGTGGATWNIGGSINLGGGGVAQTTGSGAGTINFGSLAGADTLSWTTGGSIIANINCADNQASFLNTGSISSYTRTLNVGAGSTITVQTGTTIQGTGNFTVGANTILSTDNTNGFKIAAGGCLNLNGTITIANSAVFRYTSATASQATGLMYTGLSSIGRIEVLNTGGRTVTLDQNMTLTDGLTVNGSQTLSLPAGRTLTISGNNITIAGSILSANASSVLAFTGSGDVSLPSNWTNLGGLSFNRTGNTLSFSPTTLNTAGPFTLTAGTFDLTGKTWNANEAINVNAAATVTTTSTTNLTIGGTTGTITWPTTPVNFNSLTVNGTGRTLTLTTDPVIAANIAVGAGTLSLNGRTLNLTVPLFVSGGTLDLTGATVTLAQDISVSGGTITTTSTTNFTVSGTSTTLTWTPIAGFTDLNNFTYSRAGVTMTLAGNLNIAGIYNHTAGTVNMSSRTVTFNEFNVSGTAAITVGNTTLNLNGNVNYTVAAITFNSSTSLNIGGSGTFNWTVALPSPNLLNMTMNRAGTTLTFGANINFNGNLTVTAGTLDFSTRSCVVGGVFTMNGGTVNFSGGSAILNQAISLSSGTVTTSATTNLTIGGTAGTISWGLTGLTALNNLTMNRAGQTFTIPDNLTVNGACSLTAGTLAGSIKAITFASTSSLVINGGTFSVSGCAITINGIINATSGFITNATACDFVIGGSGAITYNLSTPTAVNGFRMNRTGRTFGFNANITFGGVFRASSGTVGLNLRTVVFNGQAFIDGGTVDLTGSTASFNNDIAFTAGTATLTAITNLTVAGSGVINYSIATPTALNNFTMNRATRTFVFSGNPTFSGSLTVTAGTVNLSSRVSSVTATFTLNGGTVDISGGTLTLSGSIDVSSGTLTTTSATSLTIASGAGTLAWAGVSTPSTIGTLAMARASRTLTLNTDITVSTAFNLTGGTIDASGRSLTFIGGITFGGGVLIGDATTNMTIGGSGVLNMSSGTLPTNLNNFTLDRATPAFSYFNGVTVAGTFNINQGTFNPAGTVTLNGPVTVASGATYGANAAASLVIQNTGAVNWSGNFPTAILAFGFNRAGESVTVNTSPTFSGAFTATAGTVNLSSRTVTCNGGFIVDGGTVNLTGSTLNLNQVVNVTAGVVTTTSTTNLSFGGTIGTITWNLSGLSALNNLTMSRNAQTFTVPENITIGGALTISNGTLSSTSKTITVNSGGTFAMSGGVFDLITSNLILNGAINATAGSITNAGGSNISVGGSGTITYNLATPTAINDFTMNRSATTITLNGNTTFAGTFSSLAGTVNLSNRTIVFDGTATVNGGSVNFTGATVTFNGPVNFASGSASTSTATNYTIQGSGTFVHNFTTPAAINTVTMNRAGATFTFNQNLTFTGALTVTAGTVSLLNRIISTSGSLVVNGGTLNLSGTTLTVNSVINITSGAVTQSGSTGYIIQGTGAITWDVDRPTVVNRFALNRPSVTFPATSLTVNGPYNHTAGTLDISSQTLTLNGNLTLDGGDYLSNTSSNLIIGNTGTISMTAGTTPATLNNFTMNRATTTYLLRGPLTVAGTFTTTAGLVDASGNTLTLSGPISVGAGTALITNSTSNLSISGSGSISWVPSTPTSLNNFTFNRTGETLTFNASLNAAGIFTATDGTVDFTGRTLTSGGGFTINGGTVNLSGAGVNLNGNIAVASGVITTTSSTNISIGGGAGSISYTLATPTVLGNFNMNRASRTFTFNSDPTFSGTVTAVAGNLDFTGRTVSFSGLDMNGGTLTLNNSSITVGGAMNWVTGTVVSNTSTNFTIQGSGTISVTSAVTPANLNNFTFNRNNTTFALTGPLTVAGNFNLTAGTLDASGRSVTLSNAISVALLGNFSTNSSTNLTVDNTGTISWLGASPTAIGSFTLNRTGETFPFNSDPTFTGSFIASNGTVNFTNRTLTASSNFTVNGGTVNLTGATANLNGNIAVTSGTVTTTSTTNLSIGSGVGSITYSIATPTALGAFTMNRSSRTFAFTSDPTFSGNFTASAGSVSFVNRSPVFSANYSQSGSSIVDFSDATVALNGNIAANSGTMTGTSTTNLSIGGSGTITWSGVVIPSSLNNLTLNRASATLPLSGNITLSGTLSISSGTLNASGRTLTLSGPITIGATGTLSGSSSTNITIDGSGSVSVLGNTPTAIGNFTLNRTGETFAFTSNPSISGNLTSTAGTIDFTGRSFSVLGQFQANGGNISLSGATANLNGAINITSGAITTSSATTLNIAGSGAFTWTTVSTPAQLNSFAINRTGLTFACNTALTVSGTLALTAGDLTCSDLTLNGPWTIGTGNYLNTGSDNLTIGGTGALPASWNNGGSINNLSLDRANAVLTTANALTVNGTYSILNGTHRQLGGTLTTNGAISFGTGVVSCDPTVDFTITGTGTITGSPQIRLCRNFTMNRAATTLNLSGLNVIANNFDITAGTVNVGSATLQFQGGFSNSGTLTVAANSSLLFDGSGSVTGFPTAFTSVDSLRLNRTGLSLSRTADLTVGGAFILNAGTIDFSGRTLTLNGPIAYTGGSINENSSTSISVGGSGTISSFMPVTDLSSLVLNRASATLPLQSNLNVTSITPTAGSISTGSNTINLGTTGQITIDETNSGRILGNIQASRTVGTGSSSFGSIGYAIAAGTEDLGNVTVLRKTGPGTAVSGDASETSINAVFTINIDGSQPTSGRVITLRWLSTDDNGKDFTAGTADVWRRNTISSPWQKIANDQAFSVSGNLRIIQAVTNHFSDYTVSDDVNPLPVDLSFLKAEREGAKVTLKWQTRQERDNKGFRIEMSLDNKTFKSIGFVDGRGTTTVATDYTFTTAQTKAAYYRLMQVDGDGTEAIHGPVFVAEAGADLSMALFPNPAVDQLVIQGYKGAATVEIANAKGQIQNIVTLKSGDNLNVKELPAGVYSVKVSTVEKVWQSRFTKQ